VSRDSEQSQDRKCINLGELAQGGTLNITSPDLRVKLGGSQTQ